MAEVVVVGAFTAKDDRARLAFIERWGSREKLDAHLKSDHVADVLQRVDELFQTSDITVYNSPPGGESEKGSLAEHAGSAA